MKSKKLLHLIYIPFTGVGLYGGYRGDEWFKWRIEIFKSYTLKSLANQEEKNFIVWMSFRPQEKANPLVAQIASSLKENDIAYIFTYDGLMYWDDKFSKGFKSKFMNCGRVVRGCWRNKTWRDLIPSMIEILYNEKNSTLEQRLTNSLSKFQHYFPKAENVLMTRIDSDDMFHGLMVKNIQEMPNRFGAYIVSKGFIYNKDSNELAEYNPKTNPPFYTIVFPAEIFFNGPGHLRHYSNFKSHEDIPKVFHTAFLPDYRYCVLTHNIKNQISTIFNHPFKGLSIDNYETKKNILSEFGL